MARIKDGRQQFQSVFRSVIVHTATIDPAAVSDQSFVSGDVTITGAALGDLVLVAAGVDTVDVTLTASVTAADTVTWTLNNVSGAAPNLASSTWKFVVLKVAGE